MGRMQEKVALVTGAARGTGEQIARLLAAEGARVLVSDVLDEAGEAVAAAIGSDAVHVRLDVSLPEDWERAVGLAQERFGRLDVLVNNAARLKIQTIADTTPEDLLDLVRVNQLGPLLGIRAVTEPMRRAGGGSIVNVVSTDGLKGMNGVAAYASTKWALRGITKAAAMELAKDRIRVNAVCPEYGSLDMSAPFVDDIERAEADNATRLFPGPPGYTNLDRMLDVARTVLFLATDECAMSTGADFVVDGGITAGHLQPDIAGSD
ncbi:MAG: SDR family oxidoreductase [Proteobacteria bacterium]|nr:SDR family oxidoreductase [Pseudomonadota bacterium]